MNLKLKALFLFALLYMNFCDARINFIHIPKTGGTTIKYLLKQQFPESEITQFSGARSILHDEEKKYSKRTIMRLALDSCPVMETEVVMGHIPYFVFAAKDPDFDTSFTFTVLRDPAERILSQDRFNMKTRNKWSKSKPLALPDNFMCKMLCSNLQLEGEELLEDCIKNLEQMDHVILMEDFENGVRALFHKLGLPHPETVPHSNITTEAQRSQQRINDKLLEKIREKNELDIRLYEYCRQRFLQETEIEN